MTVEERNPNYCWAHYVVEQAEAFLICGECGHRFPSEERLVYDFNLKMAMVDVFVEETKAADIFFCPHCAHDF